MSRAKKKLYRRVLAKKTVVLSYAGGSVVEIWQELDIPSSVLMRWRRESKDFGCNSFQGKGNPRLTYGQREIDVCRRKS